MPSDTTPRVMGERERFLRFLVVGGIAASVNVLFGIVLGGVMRYENAITLAFLVGMTTAFVLSRMFVFDAAGGSVRGQYMRFAIVNAVGFVQMWAVSMGMAHMVLPWLGWTWHAKTAAHIVGVVSPIVTSYFGHKIFSFR
jgi:putative flippase GtrA